MKAFLWAEVPNCTTNYHEGGAVLIEAESLERAREIALVTDTDFNHETKKFDIKRTIRPMQGVEKEPDLILDSQSTEEKVWVFPDAGCC